LELSLQGCGAERIRKRGSIRVVPREPTLPSLWGMGAFLFSGCWMLVVAPHPLLVANAEHFVEKTFFIKRFLPFAVTLHYIPTVLTGQVKEACSFDRA